MLHSVVTTPSSWLDVGSDLELPGPEFVRSCVGSGERPPGIAHPALTVPRCSRYGAGYQPRDKARLHHPAVRRCSKSTASSRWLPSIRRKPRSFTSRIMEIRRIVSFGFRCGTVPKDVISVSSGASAETPRGDGEPGHHRRPRTGAGCTVTEVPTALRAAPSPVLHGRSAVRTRLRDIAAPASLSAWYVHGARDAVGTLTASVSSTQHGNGFPFGWLPPALFTFRANVSAGSACSRCAAEIGSGSRMTSASSPAEQTLSPARSARCRARPERAGLRRDRDDEEFVHRARHRPCRSGRRQPAASRAHFLGRSASEGDLEERRGVAGQALRSPARRVAAATAAPAIAPRQRRNERRLARAAARLYPCDRQSNGIARHADRASVPCNVHLLAGDRSCAPADPANWRRYRRSRRCRCRHRAGASFSGASNDIDGVTGTAGRRRAGRRAQATAAGAERSLARRLSRAKSRCPTRLRCRTAWRRSPGRFVKLHGRRRRRAQACCASSAVLTPRCARRPVSSPTLTAFLGHVPP